MKISKSLAKIYVWMGIYEYSTATIYPIYLQTYVNQTKSYTYARANIL